MKLLLIIMLIAFAFLPYDGLSAQTIQGSEGDESPMSCSIDAGDGVGGCAVYSENKNTGTCQIDFESAEEQKVSRLQSFFNIITGIFS